MPAGFKRFITAASPKRTGSGDKADRRVVVYLGPGIEHDGEQIADGDPQANLRYGKNGVSHVCGTRYQRVWKGKKYEVTALGNGKFEYDGTVYQSLSAIAREITGTRWNGKLFFGVK